MHDIRCSGNVEGNKKADQNTRIAEAQKPKTRRKKEQFDFEVVPFNKYPSIHATRDRREEESKSGNTANISATCVSR